MSETGDAAPARALCCFHAPATGARFHAPATGARFHAPATGARLGAVYGQTVVDLTAREPVAVASLAALLAAGPAALDDLLQRYAGASADYAYADLDRAPAPDAPHLLAPIDAQEVWAAGVTYTRSRQARMEESAASADVYARVYDAARPELFFKATPGRVVGPHGPIAVRDDSTWTVPEPELTVLLDRQLRTMGYTIGNDLTARDIEGQNPLYLPQAKVYDRGCALGPIVVPAAALDPYGLNITCEIQRDDEVIFAAETGTAALHRRIDDLVAYLSRHNSFASGCYLMTGTGIVPPDSVALRRGDTVVITIGGIGALRNTVA